MKKHSLFSVFLFVLVLTVMSCKPTVPGTYIQPDEMEDILYDYHVSQAMVDYDEQEDREYVIKLYRLGVLKKHGVTEAEFDSSLVYYTRHADRLRKIYENLATRLEKDAVALGATASDLNQLGNDVAGDTANIWNAERHTVLMRNAPYNVMSYKVAADTSFHKGDRVILSFDTHFIFQDGYKDGVAMLAMRLGNDSVVSRTVHLASNSRYSLELTDRDKLGIKAVSGFIYLSDDANSTETTLKLLFINNIRLVRFHESNAKEGTDNSAVKPVGGDTSNVRSENIQAQPASDIRNMPSRRMPMDRNAMPLREMKAVDKIEMKEQK